MQVSVPLIQATRPTGIYQVCTTANTDYVLTVPTGATGCVIWFETSAANAALLSGRIGVHTDNTVVGSITHTSTNLGYVPAIPVEFSFRAGSAPSSIANSKDRFVHVACNTALAVVRGFWLYAYNEV